MRHDITYCTSEYCPLHKKCYRNANNHTHDADCSGVHSYANLSEGDFCASPDYGMFMVMKLE